MSIYAESEFEMSQIASNRGWGQFGDWAENLDIGKYLAVAQLWEYGYYSGIKILKQQLIAAKTETSPSKSVIGIIDAILAFEPEDDFILITNGIRKSAG